MALTAERLRNDDRFTGENVTQFLLFLPFGICLFVFRIFLALILWVAAIILPNKSTVRQMLTTLACWTFGVYVRVSGRRDERCSVLVANYVSCLDSLAAAHALGAVTLRKWKVPPFFASTLGIRNAAQFVRKEQFGECALAPLLLQPEGGPSGGRALLRFQEWPVPAPPRVQPVAIRVERAWTAVTLARGAGFPWRDALWFLLAPATVFRVALLPAAAPGRTAAAIADHLQIEATDIEFSALCRAGSRAAAGGAGGAAGAGGGGGELARRARQVKEVLPRVPLPDIMRDLAVTRSVDVTVTNFLEGVTPYAPEPEPAPACPSSPSAPSPCPPPFPRSARERQRGYQERKARMVAEARARYVEKHGLDRALSG